MAAQDAPEPPVLLGFAGEPLPSGGDRDPYSNKIGGLPMWLLRTAPEPERTLCGTCGRELALVAQLYSPLDAMPRYHRVLYIFACVVPACAAKPTGWKVLRAQLFVAERDDDSQARDLDAAKVSTPASLGWATVAPASGASSKPSAFSAAAAAAASDDDDDDDDVAILELLAKRSASSVMQVTAKSVAATAAAAAAASATASASASVTASGAPGSDPEWPVLHEADSRPERIAYTALSLHISDEPHAPRRAGGAQAARLLESYEAEEAKKAAAGKSDDSEWREAYERTTDPLRDRFYARLRRAPAQVLRYSERALWLAAPEGCNVEGLLDDEDDDDVADAALVLEPTLAACGLCGGPRVFELQLVATVASALRLATVPEAWSGAPLRDDVASSAASAGAEREPESPARGLAAGVALDANVKAEPLPSGPSGAALEASELASLVDWETALVFACAASCHAPLRSDGYCDELVVLQR